MIRCEGDENKGRAHLWDPSWEIPKIINFAMQLPQDKIIGKSIVRWLDVESIFPSIFFSDSQDCILASLSNPEATDNVPWHESEAMEVNIYGERAESPLNLVQAEEKRPFRRVKSDALSADENSFVNVSEGSEELDDTFHFLGSKDR